MLKSVPIGLTIILCCSLTGALAADLPPLPIKAPATPASSDWSGFYLGLGTGFRSTQTDSGVTRVTQNGADALAACITGFSSFGGCTTGEPLHDSAFRVNPYMGFNFQVTPRWVVGIEGDVGFADKATTLGGFSYPVSFTGIAADSFGVHATWDASVRGRVGYLATPAVMLYATGGVTWLHLESTSTCNSFVNGNCSPAAGSGPMVITDTTDKLGWTVGGGLEAMLTPNWIARGEYRYADYGTISNTDHRAMFGGFLDQILSYDLRVKTHTATFGIAYKFGGSPAGPLSAYASAAPEPGMTAASWSGPYLGLGLGARSSLADANMTALTFGGVNSLTGMCNTLANFGKCVTGAPVNGTAFKALPYAGYNWLVAPRWIAGIEGDIGFADKTTTLAGMTYPLSGIAAISGRAVEGFGVRTTWDASLRGRAGFLVNPSVLVYGTGGVAVVRAESTSTCGNFPNALCSPAVSSGPFVITDAKNRVGWTGGGGIEATLASNWIARADYRFADFGAVSNTDVRTGGVGVVATYDLRLRTHTATLGVAYKFDWPGVSR